MPSNGVTEASAVPLPGKEDTRVTSETVLREQLIAIRPKNLILTLFGDYIYPRGGEIWTGSLIHLLRLLDVSSDQAVRAALSRMTRKGWLKSRRVGRHSYYSLTAQGESLLEAGTDRIFSQRQPTWDGRWWVLCYRIPERRRRVRARLRRELTWMGFGRLGVAVYISPHDRRRELDELLRRLRIQEHVDLFVGRYEGYTDDRELVRQAWDLDGLNRQYAAFLGKYQPLYESDRAAMASDAQLAPADCFVRRFMLVHEYRAFPFMDPGLPPELLPGDWLGHQARRLFHQYYDLLTGPALSFFEEAFEAAPDSRES